MLVGRKVSDDPRVMPFCPPMNFGARLARRYRQLLIKRGLAPYQRTRPAGVEPFGDDRSRFGGSLFADLPDTDVVNLHWVAGFVDFQALFRALPARRKLVWTLHDMAPFTGGCHYNGTCNRYRSGCSGCPQLGAGRADDLAARAFRRKQQVLASFDPAGLRIVAPSRWLADQARGSALFGRFPVDVIPNGLDLEVFRPRDRDFARSVLGIAGSAKVILFVADNMKSHRKGMDLLLRALGGMRQRDNVLLLTVGFGQPRYRTPLPLKHLGGITLDGVMSLAYSAADLFVIPSRQDNLPNTVIESLACGTPVVGFRIGGIPDMVRDGETGLLAEPEDAESLARAIEQLLDDEPLRLSMRAACRQIAERDYDLQLQARRYRDLYRACLAEAP
jgi:glycosyltransferase involved in cell wall biosynthesis